MKQIDFWNENRLDATHFWQPWNWGCLVRLILFIVLLAALLLLLSLFRSCEGARKGDDPWHNIITPVSPDSIYSSPITDNPISDDTSTDDHWGDPIDGGEDVGLPAPDDNTLPTPGPGNIIENPEDDGATRIVDNQLYVILDSESNDETFKTFAKRFSALYPTPQHSIVYYNRNAKTLILEVPAATRMTICNQLNSQITEVDFIVVPIEMMTSRAERPNDPAFSNEALSWYFAPIQAYEAWEITQGSRDVIIGIVDSYMDLSHGELAGDRIVYPYSVRNRNSNVAPYSGLDMGSACHGTFVTSVAAGNMNNHLGGAGIAPNCRIMPVSCGLEGGALTNASMVEGLLFCMYHGADVINLSMGMQFTDEVSNLPISDQIAFSEQALAAEQRMWDYVFSLAERRNVTIVWAAGNNDVYAAMDASKRNENTLRVSAVGHDLERADFSNFGNFPSQGVEASTISAPGVDILGAIPGNRYDLWPGTSFAAPIITGAVALMKSINRNLTTSEIIEILQETGRPCPNSPEIGKLVQIKDALLRVKGQLARFDEVANNLVGYWESTRLLDVVRGRQFTGEKVRLRFRFTSTSAGTIEHIVLDGEHSSAPIIVQTSSSQIRVRPTQQSGSFTILDYTLKADDEGLLICEWEGPFGNTVTCNLRRINE